MIFFVGSFLKLLDIDVYILDNVKDIEMSYY